MKPTKQVNRTQLAKALRSYRKERGLGDYELSKSLNITSVRNYEYQEHAPSNWALKKMANAAQENGLRALEEIFRKELLLRQAGITADEAVDPAEVLQLMNICTAKELAVEVLRLRAELQKLKQEQQSSTANP